MTYFSYVEQVNVNLICCVCQCPFLNPVVTTTCSHTFCRKCIERSLEQQPCCPVDRSPLTVDDLKPENLLLRNMVDELIVECPYKALGCTSTCQRQLLEGHLKDTCQYIPVPCSEDGCEQMLFRRDVGNHTHDCVHRLAKCSMCGTSVSTSHLEAHSHECAEHETKCVACSETYKRSEMSEHIATCSEAEVTCEQSAHGCPWTGKRKTLAAEHLQTCPYDALKGFFTIYDTRMSSMRDENTVLRQNLSKAETSLDALNRELVVARRLLGPWWRSSDTPRAPSTDLSEQMAPAQPRQGPSEHYRWRRPNPLSPILSFSPEASPISPAQEVDSISGSGSPVPSFSDPTFLASYFPSGPADTPGTNAPGFAPAMPLDPLAGHLFPFSSRIQRPFPAPPLRPEFPSTGAPSTSSSPRVAPIDVSTSLESTLLGLRNSIASVSGALDALARRTDVALTTENLRMNEEVGALRAIVHGLRMQVHALITERNGSAWGPTTTTTTYYNHPPPAPNPPLVINSTTQTTKL